MSSSVLGAVRLRTVVSIFVGFSFWGVAQAQQAGEAVEEAEAEQAFELEQKGRMDTAAQILQVQYSFFRF